jgi:DNA-binding protein HU-beta
MRNIPIVTKNLLIVNVVAFLACMLIDKIAAGAEITKAQAKAALEATTNALKEALIAGDKIQLVGFGTFSINERPAREGINPATKEKIQIAAKKVAKFKAGAELADAINK